jgi:hypothetical protein
LLAASILYIIFSVFTLFVAGSQMAAPVLPPVTIPWNIFYIHAFIVSVFGLFIGIMAVANRTRTEKAGLLKTLGNIAVALVVVGVILSFSVFVGALGGAAAILAFSAIVGLVLPVLYIVGAQKNLTVEKLN